MAKKKSEKDAQELFESNINPKTILPLEKKLAEIRKSLLADLSVSELQRLQVHADLLESALTAAHNYHHHDTNEHHDHDTAVLTPGLEPRAIRGLR